MPFTFDASDTIPSGSAITDVTVTVVDESGTDVTETMAPSAATFDGTTIVIVFAAGTSGKSYLATIVMTTDLPSTHTDTLNLLVQDDEVEVIGAVDTTLAEFKRLMKLTNDDEDDRLRIMIPAVKAFVADYCGAGLRMPNVRMTSDQLAFVAADGDTAAQITDAGGLLLDYGFTSDCHVYIEGSLNNDGLVHVLTAEAGTLTLSPSYDLIAEAAGTVVRPANVEDSYDTSDTNFVTITRVRFPGAVKLAMALMLEHQLRMASHSQEDQLLASESIGNYSRTYSKRYNDGDFPKSAMMTLNAYRVPGV